MKKLLFLFCSVLLTFYSANSQSISTAIWGGYQTNNGYVMCSNNFPLMADRMTIRLGSNFSNCSAPCWQKGNSYYPIQQLYMCGTSTYPSCMNNAPLGINSGSNTYSSSMPDQWEYGAFVIQNGQYVCIGTADLGTQFSCTANDLDIDVYRTSQNANLQIHLFVRNPQDVTEIYKIAGGIYFSSASTSYNCNTSSCNWSQSALGIYNLTSISSITNYTYGCTSSSANNYNSNAIYDDGSCCYVAGCTDSLGINYNPSACYNDGSCIYPIYGCMDPTMFNYNPLANTSFNPSNCIPFVYGCTISGDLNYNPLANTDDGSCASFNYGCTDSTAFNYSVLAIIDDNSCIAVVNGCTDSTALNYNSSANTNDGSCITIVYGCMDPLATNYNAVATVDDGSCSGYATANIVEDTINTCNSFTSISAQLVSNTSYVWSTQLSTPLTNFQQLINQGYSISGLLSGGMPIDSAIGLTYQGGIVFYVDEINEMMYIASPQDLTYGNSITNCPGMNTNTNCNGGNRNEWWSYYQCPGNGFTHVSTGATATNIGSGQSNTALAVSGSYPSRAAQLCDNSTMAGYSDWFLPSKDELNEMYQRKAEITGNGNACTSGFHTDLYWSSSEIASTNTNPSYDVWTQRFQNGTPEVRNKDNGLYVRAIRSTSFNMPNNISNTYFVGSTGMYYVTVTDSVGYTATDSVYVNFVTTGICGCTDPSSSNYNPLATYDDGTCIPCIYGCMDSTSSNYNINATCDDGTCIPCIYGCMDTTALNYNSVASCDDGSCILPIYGCMDSTMGNYNPLANIDDGSCAACIYGCMDTMALNYNAVATCDDGTCIPCIYGCMDSTALNYNLIATCDDGSCNFIVYGCMDPSALNYDPLAVVDDSSCCGALPILFGTQIGQDLIGEDDGDLSGTSVSMSGNGNIVAIGASNNDGDPFVQNGGHVRVYENINGTWNQLGQDIDGEANGDKSGTSVSLSSDGNTVAIGAPYNDGNGINSGHVRVYNYDGSSWIQLGQDIDGEAADDMSGTSVSINGNTVAISAYNNDGNGSESGHVRVYNYDGSSWVQLGQDIDGEAAGDHCGGSDKSISLSNNGNTVAIGAGSNNGVNGSGSGHVRVYNYNGSSWVQLGQDIDGEAAVNYSGRAVSLSSDGNTVAIGSMQNNDGGTEAGHARVYSYNGSSWIQIGQDIDGVYAGEHRGFQVDLNSNGNMVAVSSLNSNSSILIYKYENSSWVQEGSEIFSSNSTWGATNISFNNGKLAIGEKTYGPGGSDKGRVQVFSVGSNTSSPCSGCTDSIALNYDPYSLIDDGSCNYIYGCTDSLAGNYNSNATMNDGSCCYTISFGSSIGQKIVGTAIYQEMGRSMAMSGDGSILVIGSPDYDGPTQQSGKVDIYELDYNTPTQWILTQSLYGNEDQGSFGWDVALNDDGSHLIIGEYRYCYSCGNNTYRGRALVYQNNGNSFIPKGQEILGAYGNDNLGHSVDINHDGSIIAVGAPKAETPGFGGNYGEVRIYEYDGSGWIQKGQSIYGVGFSDYSGSSVSINSNGNIIAIGAPDDFTSSNANPGKVRVFNWNGSNWNQLGIDITGINLADATGYSVDLSADGDILLIGSPQLYTANKAGYVSSYTFDGNNWNQFGSTLSGNIDDRFGFSISLSGNANSIAVGANSGDWYDDNQYVNVYDFNNDWNLRVDTISNSTERSYFGYAIATDNNFKQLAVSNPWYGSYHVNNGGPHYYQYGAVDVFNIGLPCVNGCTDSSALNYNSTAAVDDGSCCYISGCTDSSSLNYNPLACIDDSSCIPTVFGCMDAMAYNYNLSANTDDGSCLYCDLNNSFVVMQNTPNNCDGMILANASSSNGPIVYSWNTGSNQSFLMNLCYGIYYITITDMVGCVIQDTVLMGITYGCTDSTALNYNPLANNDDGTCISFIYGCMDSIMFNYNPLANTDDGTCISFIYGCMDSTMFNYNPLVNTDDGTCISFIYGCMDTVAYNYNLSANTNNGSCLYCDLNNSFIVIQNTSNNCDGIIIANSTSSNSPITYLWSNGSTQNNIVGLCAGIYTLVISDAVGCNIIDTITIGTLPIYGCTGPSYCNYDPLATIDDGSCAGMFGCTDPLYLEYSAAASCDDGSCVTLIVNTSCGASAITGLGVTNVIHDRVTLIFDNMNTYDASGAQICRVDQLRIRYREVGTSTWSQKNMAAPTGYDPITGICNSTQNTDKLVLGLSGSTTYEWEMRVWYCATGSTAWVDGPNFTTADNCPDVGNLVVTSGSNTQATFTWDDSNGAYSFVRLQARVDTVGSSFFNIGGVGVNYGTFTKNKNGLVAGESYRAKSRTWCDPNGGAYKAPSWTSFIYWTQPTSIRVEGGSAINNLFIYPNPSRDIFNISFTSDTKQNLKVRILNVIGEELINDKLEQFIGEYTKQIDLTNNAKGIYFLEIETNDGIINKKLILQ